MTHHRFLFRTAAAVASLLLLSSLPLLAGDSFTAKVRAVSDGDTLVVAKGGKVYVVQLAGIDAPELSQEFGSTARDHVRDMTRGKKVTVEIVETNSNKSVVANVSIDGNDLAASLVDSGHAWATDGGSTEQLRASQAKAKTAGEGLWASSNPTAPWEYRKSA